MQKRASLAHCVLRRTLPVCAHQHLDVVGASSVSATEDRQRPAAVCDVTTQQNAGRSAIQTTLCELVQSGLSVAVTDHQLPTDLTTV